MAEPGLDPSPEEQLANGRHNLMPQIPEVSLGEKRGYSGLKAKVPLKSRGSGVSALGHSSCRDCTGTHLTDVATLRPLAGHHTSEDRDQKAAFSRKPWRRKAGRGTPGEFIVLTVFEVRCPSAIPWHSF